MDETFAVGFIGGPILGVELSASERSFLVRGKLDRTRVGLGEPDEPVGQSGQVVRVRMAKDGGGAEPVVQWVVTDQLDRLVAELGDPAGLVVGVRVVRIVEQTAHTNRCHAESTRNELQPTAESKDGKVAQANDLAEAFTFALVVCLWWGAMTRDEHRPDSVPPDQVGVDVAVSGKETDIASQVTESIGDSGAGSEKPVACPPVRRGVFVVDVEDHRTILHDPSTEHTTSLAGV